MWPRSCDLSLLTIIIMALCLSLQLWQSNGLDLYIIPYGCIATGHNMGMIQVVQDAETVAKVTNFPFSAHPCCVHATDYMRHIIRIALIARPVSDAFTKLLRAF